MKPLPETTFILDGRATLFRRPRSSLWQVRFKVDNRWLHFTTGTDSLAEAKDTAFELFFDAWYKSRNHIPVVTKNFRHVANLVIEDLEQLLATEQAKVTYQDYIWALQKYMIPFFGQYQFTDITQKLVKQFDDWRTIKMRRRPSGSHLSTHNTAMNRVSIKH